MNGKSLHPFILWIFLLTFPLFSSGKTEELRNEKVRNALKSLPSSYQKELPKQRRPRKVKKQRKLTCKQRKQKKRQEAHFSFNAPVGGSAILRIVMYVILGVVVLFFVIWLINYFRNRDLGSDGGDGLKVHRVAGGDEEPSYDISDADKLAGKGRLTEAIHLLYLKVIHWLQKRGSLKIKKSLTNREILRASSLSFEKTRTLGTFISLVEELYFGDVPATQAHYNKSKDFAESIMGSGDA